MSNSPQTILPKPSSAESNNLVEVAKVFLRLGFTGFGGPAAHIAMMQEEVVQRRKWLNNDQFLDLLAATNLIPGPNSTEMAIHLGFVRAGWPGLIVGGLSFIIPTVLIVLGIAWGYVQYGSYPQVSWLLYGIKPVVIILILQALILLGKTPFQKKFSLLVGIGCLAGYLWGLSEIALLLLSGSLVMLVENRHRLKAQPFPIIFLNLSGIPFLVERIQDINLGRLFFSFLKIGSILYGSGYVLIAYLRAEFVTNLGWLTDTQLIDAVSIGQFTPGPLSSTATFVGYILGSWQGALLATIGMFLPSFIFVAVSNPIVPRLRHSAMAGSFLNGVIIASLSMMAGVIIQLSTTTFTDPITVTIAFLAGILIFVFKTPSIWLMIGGSIIGLLSHLI